MNADRLLAHYEKIADAPDAVPRLRRFILALAVRGKLVEQDTEDESATELLKRIVVEMAENAPCKGRQDSETCLIYSTQSGISPPLGTFLRMWCCRAATRYCRRNGLSDRGTPKNEQGLIRANLLGAGNRNPMRHEHLRNLGGYNNLYMRTTASIVMLSRE